MNRLEIIKEVYGERELTETALLNLMKVIELTAKECIGKIETYRIRPSDRRTFDALVAIRNNIKEHFGVKE